MSGSVVGTGGEQSERLALDGSATGLYGVRLEGRQSGTRTARLLLER